MRELNEPQAVCEVIKDNDNHNTFFFLPLSYADKGDANIVVVVCVDFFPHSLLESQTSSQRVTYHSVLISTRQQHAKTIELLSVPEVIT